MLNRALSLNERVALTPANFSDEQVNEVLLRRWQSQKPFDQKAFFDLRLTSAGLSRKSFSSAISLDVSKLTIKSPEPTIIDLNAASRSKYPGWQDLLKQVTPHNASGLESFPALVGPLLVDVYHEVKDIAQDCNQSVPIAIKPFCQSAWSYLLGQIARMSQRTLLSNLHRARKQGLAGETPEARFQSYCDLLADSQYSEDLLLRYPVLARQMLVTIKQWQTMFEELLRRYTKDAHEIESTFFAETSSSSLVGISMGEGDSHCGGRTVSFLHFANNTTLVYKPRSLAVDLAFEGLLNWMNDNGLDIQLKSPKAINHGDYGWAEFIPNLSCESEEEVATFFQRQGALLAVLYLLNASDFHHENLIAHGAFPVPIDLETLLQPNLHISEVSKGLATPSNPIFQTVQEVGILPDSIWGGKNKANGVDMSGMSDDEAMSPIDVLVLEDKGTDHMRMVRKPVQIPLGKHRVLLNEKPISGGAYSKHFVDGFTEAYDFIHAQKDQLLRSGSPLNEFDGVEVRVILRPTFYYSLLLSDSFHPSVLGDGLEQDLYFDRLWLNVQYRKSLARVVEAERRAMWRCDIPRFASKTNEQSLLTCTGSEIPGFWAETPMTSLRKKLANFGEHDRARQTWLVEKTVGTMGVRKATGAYEEYQLATDLKPLSSEVYLNKATKVADRLIELSYQADDGGINWKTCMPTGAVGSWIYRNTSFELYGGIPGICLFFAHVGHITGNNHYTQAARGAWQTVQHLIQTMHQHIASPGAFAGWGGLLYTAFQLSQLWNDESILHAVIGQLPAPNQLLQNNQSFDIIDGAAGFILATLPIIEAGYTELQTHVDTCGEYLLNTAKTMNDGIGWHLEVSGPKPLGGFSHGAAGIAYTLFSLAHHSKDQRYYQAAIQALEYDRSLYCPCEGNWRDLREGQRPGEVETMDEHFINAWCHGAPGIGLSRLLIQPYYQDEQLQTEIQQAVSKTRAEGFGKNHSLCHGDLGNLEFLNRAADYLGDEELKAHCQQLAAGVMDSIERLGWKCGFPPNTEPLGLMVGLAGIGYGLLKLAEPGRVPSVLGLEI